MTEKKGKFAIFDGNAILHRAFHALPPLKTKDGKLVNAVYGFATILLKALKDLKPEYAAVAFDTKAPTFRDEAYAEYKATREKKPQDLYDQIPIIKEMLVAFRIPIYEKDGYEADDIIGTLATKALAGSTWQVAGGKKEEQYQTTRHEPSATSNLEVVIVTGDLDTLQLVGPHTKVYTLRRGMTDTVICDEDFVRERYGIAPRQVVDFKALRGDPSDNIPGVKGIGEKTAAELIRKFGSVENMYQALEHKKGVKDIPERVQKTLEEHKDAAFLSRKLATIVQDAPVPFVLKEARLSSPNRAKVVELFQQLEFKSLLPRLPALWGKEKGTSSEKGGPARPSFAPQKLGGKFGPQEYVLVDTNEKFETFLRELTTQRAFVLDTETTSLNPLDAQLLGMSFCGEEGKAFYAVLNGKPERLKALKPLLEDPKISKMAHNAKYDLAVLRTAGIHLGGLAFDTMIASYLLNPGTRQHNLENLVFTEFGYEMMPIEALIGKKGKGQLTMDAVPVERLSWYSCEDADFTLRLANKLERKLAEKDLENLFQKIEMPLISVLEEMERCGVALDLPFLARMNKEVTRKMDELQGNITKLAGVEFNVNSPVQLKKVLFEKLKIVPRDVHRTKTGLSTAASELQKLKNAHPLIPLILEYRELAKLHSTYLEALPKLVHPKTGRVHTSFNQTVAATGRLSSSDPNLQNIPIRTELGKEIRKAFIAPKGYALLAADYSQIELRIIASLAGDAKMIEAFQSEEDIHRRTAAEIWERRPEDVTDTMRRNAKAINFGIIYGMGFVGLAESTGISREEAQSFIDKYFSLHQGIARYIEETKALAYKLGYVETLFGRRRFLPELKSEHPAVRSASEREAINTPIQGTAADLIKLAMIAIDHEIRENGRGEIRMILQVHDELVFEVREEQLAKWAKIVRDTMEHVYKLKVPIEVHLEHGKNWGKMEKVGV